MDAKKLLGICQIEDFKEQGDEFIMRCAKNRDTTPSCRLNREGYFHCFSCGAHGSAVEFVIYRLSINHHEARRLIGGSRNKFKEVTDLFKPPRLHMSGIKIHERLKPYDLSKKSSLYSPNETVLQYLESRGIDLDLISKFNIRMSKTTGYGGPKKVQVVFPLTLDGVCYGTTSRIITKSSGPKYIHSDGLPKTKLLFGFDQYKKINSLWDAIIVEGPFDVLKLHSAKLPIALATFGGEPSEPQIDLLRRLKVRRLLVAYDDDRAGWQGTIKLFDEFIDYFDKVNIWNYNVDKNIERDIGDLSINEIKLLYCKDNFHGAYVRDNGSEKTLRLIGDNLRIW